MSWREEVSYLWGKIMFLKTSTSIRAPIGSYCLHTSRLCGSSSAGSTAEEVVLVQMKASKKQNELREREREREMV